MVIQKKSNTSGDKLVRERIEKELILLRQYYSDIVYVEEGQWIFFPDYPIPSGLGWNRDKTNVCFQIPLTYPGGPPYGFYIPTGLQYNNQMPNSYKEPSDNKPPFDGIWGFLSWTQNGGWRPTTDLSTGSNLLNYVKTFKDRFLDGR